MYSLSTTLLPVHFVLQLGGVQARQVWSLCLPHVGGCSGLDRGTAARAGHLPGGLPGDLAGAQEPQLQGPHQAPAAAHRRVGTSGQTLRQPARRAVPEPKLRRRDQHQDSHRGGGLAQAGGEQEGQATDPGRGRGCRVPASGDCGQAARCSEIHGQARQQRQPADECQERHPQVANHRDQPQQTAPYSRRKGQQIGEHKGPGRRNAEQRT